MKKLLLIALLIILSQSNIYSQSGKLSRAFKAFKLNVSEDFKAFKSSIAEDFAAFRSIIANDNVYKTQKDLLLYRVYNLLNDSIETDTNIVYKLSPIDCPFLRYRVVQSSNQTYIMILPCVKFGNLVTLSAKDSTMAAPTYTNSVNAATTFTLSPTLSGSIITNTTTTRFRRTLATTTTPTSTITTTSPTKTVSTTTNIDTIIVNGIRVKDSLSITTSTITPNALADNVAMRTIEFDSISYSDSPSNPSNYYFQIKDSLDPTNHYLAAQRIKGMPLTMPFKLRPNRPKEDMIELNLSLGYCFGYRVKLGNNPYKDNYFNFIPYAVALNKDNYINSINGQESKGEDAFSLTYIALGGSFEFSGLNLGIFTGWDMMFGSQKNWVNQNKNWVSFGIGFKFASTN